MGQWVTSGGVETNYPMALRYVLATVPALAAYNDGQGHAATISYPNNGAKSATPTPKFPQVHPSQIRRTISTFSCDIAYSRSPAASRASARST